MIPCIAKSAGQCLNQDTTRLYVKITWDDCEQVVEDLKSVCYLSCNSEVIDASETSSGALIAHTVVSVLSGDEHELRSKAVSCCKWTSQKRNEGGVGPRN